jgi:hypothetical protein
MVCFECGFLSVWPHTERIVHTRRLYATLTEDKENKQTLWEELLTALAAQRHRHVDFRCIVFVRTRALAYLLAECIKAASLPGVCAAHLTSEFRRAHIHAVQV